MKSFKDLQGMVGSWSRDAFKWLHKQTPFTRKQYAADLDFVLISKRPPGIVAFVDFKRPYDSVTFSEAIMYNALMQIAPVYIITGNINKDWPPDLKNVRIERYTGGDWRPKKPIVDLKTMLENGSIHDLYVWECNLRNYYEMTNGYGRTR